MPKKVYSYENRLIFTYSDGSSETVVGDAVRIRKRFCYYVMLVLPSYVDGLVSVELSDSSGHVYKRYVQGLENCRL